MSHRADVSFSINGILLTSGVVAGWTHGAARVDSWKNRDATMDWGMSSITCSSVCDMDYQQAALTQVCVVPFARGVQTALTYALLSPLHPSMTVVKNVLKERAFALRWVWLQESTCGVKLRKWWMAMDTKFLVLFVKCFEAWCKTFSCSCHCGLRGLNQLLTNVHHYNIWIKILM